MLVITRYQDECIRITCPDGNHIDVVLCQAFARRAKIGIVAPLEYAVDRLGETSYFEGGALRDDRKGKR